jgi:glycosyltransferase involved in cell wall biosynthesis
MNATLVSGIYPPDIGGPATFIPQFAKELIGQGHNVSVVSLRSPKLSQRQFTDWDEFFISRNIPLPIRFPLTVLRIIRVARNSEVIFANGLHQEVAVANVFLRKRAVAKIVGDPVWERYVNRNKSSAEVISLEEFGLSSQKTLERKFLTWSLNRYKGIITPGRSLEALIRAWGVSIPIHYLPNGTSRTNLNRVSQVKYDFVVVNRLVKWKNVDQAIRAISGTNFRLAVVGHGPELSNLSELAARNQAKVEFLGNLSQDEVEQVMTQSTAFCLLSSYEGMSFSLLRAMMLGKPIIVSNIPANTDVIDHNVTGIIVDASDLIQIQEAFRQIMTGSQLSQKLGRNASKKAQKLYDLELVLKKTTQILTQDSK